MCRRICFFQLGLIMIKWSQACTLITAYTDSVCVGECSDSLRRSSGNRHNCTQSNLLHLVRQNFESSTFTLWGEGTRRGHLKVFTSSILLCLWCSMPGRPCPLKMKSERTDRCLAFNADVADTSFHISDRVLSHESFSRCLHCRTQPNDSLQNSVGK